jgi:hypothetical protein
LYAIFKILINKGFNFFQFFLIKGKTIAWLCTMLVFACDLGTTPGQAALRACLVQALKQICLVTTLPVMRLVDALGCLYQADARQPGNGNRAPGLSVRPPVLTGAYF